MKEGVEEALKMRTSAQVREGGRLERGTMVRWGGGREAEGEAAAASAATAHLRATSPDFFWTAAGSEAICALMASQASRWP